MYYVDYNRCAVWVLSDTFAFKNIYTPVKVFKDVYPFLIPESSLTQIPRLRALLLGVENV